MLKVKVDTSVLQKKMKYLEDELKKKQGPLIDSGLYMIGETMQNIAKQRFPGQPNGSWPKLKDSTLFYKRKDGGKTWKKVASAPKGTRKNPNRGGVRYSAKSQRMRDTNNLMSTIDFIAKKKNYVVIQATAKYAKAQQKITRFMGVVEKNRKKVKIIFEDFKRKIIKKSGFNK